ncbi:MAG: MFS transporter [Armatimonadota bacterium]
MPCRLFRSRLAGSQAVGPFYFLTYAAVAVLGQFVSVYLRDLGFSYSAIGALSAVTAACGALSQGWVGAFSDIVRRRWPFITGGALLLSTVYLIYPMARAFPSFLALHALAGVFSYTALTAAAALALDLALPGRVSRSFASARIWGSVGYVLAMLSIVASPALLEPPRMFLAGAAFYAAAGLSILAVRSETGPGTSRMASMTSGLALLKHPIVTALLAFCFLYWVSLQGSFSLVALFIKHLGGGRAMMAGAWIVAATIEIPFMLWLARCSDKYGRRPVLLLASLALPLRLLAYSAVSDPRLVLPIQALHGVTFGVTAVAPLSYMNDIVAERLRASGQGLLNTCLAAASAVGPFLAGALGDWVGLHRAFLALCVPAIAALAILAAAVPESRGTLSPIGAEPQGGKEPLKQASRRSG